MTTAIEAEGLTKRFGATQALAGVDLSAREGTVLGVLGPNGAGKTTAVRCLATLVRPDAGRARVAGHDVLTDPAAVRSAIGLTGQYASVDEDLTGTQNLLLLGQLLGLRTRDARARAAELLEQFDLTEAGGRTARTYSGGMRRRLDLAAGLVGRPSVVFLDEPTTGLDPARREEMWDVVRRVVADGATVLLTTQYLEEADALADEITVVDRGRVIAHDTVDGLKQHAGGRRPAGPAGRPRPAGGGAGAAGRADRAAPADTGRGELTCRVTDDTVLPGLVARLQTAGIAVSELSLHLPTLDEVFLTLTGHPRADDPAGEGGGMTTATATSGPAAPTVTAVPAGSGVVRQATVLARRSLLKTWRTPEALVDVTLQPVVFLVLFTYVFGGAIAGGSRQEYLQFLLPGVLGQTIALASVSLGQNLNADIRSGVFDRFRSLPIARSAPLVGAVLADLVRYLVLFTVTMAVGTLMGFEVTTSWVGVLAALALSTGFALCFGWISVYVGMLARSPGAVQGIVVLLVLPLTFGSNTFVPTETLPGWLQAFVEVNPVSHLVSAVRGLVTGGPVAGHLGWTLVWMAVLLAVFAPLAVRAYRRRA
jgi:ABC transporter DrrB family efflux protein